MRLMKNTQVNETGNARSKKSSYWLTALVLAGLIAQGCVGDGNSTVGIAKDVSGRHVFEIDVWSTEVVSEEARQQLLEGLVIHHLPEGVRQMEGVNWWHAASVELKSDRAEVTVSLNPVTDGTVAGEFVWQWPDGFEPVRPSVLQVSGQQALEAAEHTGVGTIKQPVYVPDKKETPQEYCVRKCTSNGGAGWFCYLICQPAK